MNIEDSIAECRANIANILDSLLSLKQGKDGGNKSDGKIPIKKKWNF